MLGMRYINGQWVDSLGNPILQFVPKVETSSVTPQNTIGTSEFGSLFKIIDNLKETDPVNSPKHYARGKYEVIKIIEYFKLNFRLANVVKYVLRAGVKNPDKHIEDLEKARWYLDREIKILKGEIVVGDDADD